MKRGGCFQHVSMTSLWLGFDWPIFRWQATVIDTDSVTESMGKAQSEVESLDLDENMFESLKEFPRTNYDEKQDVWQTHL